jgi:hypothetical protein
MKENMFSLGRISAHVKKTLNCQAVKRRAWSGWVDGRGMDSCF